MSYFLIRAVENLDPHQAEVSCYHDGTACDDLTNRFQAAASGWREVAGWSDGRIAEQIRADQIDILFDLSGHTAGNRLMVFARKPAPIQMTWIGYEGTTGLSAMDYILADRHVVPADAECHYSEKVLRLPDCYMCYDPPPDAQPVAPVPALERGYVTFGCFNNPAKIAPGVIEVWAEILHRVPGSRLVLKYRGLTEAANLRRFRQSFAAEGIDPARLELLDHSPYVKYLAEYGRIDIALDPFPFCGGVTTCEALWSGVPVVSRSGETFASRHSLSYFSALGLTERVAGSFEEYVALACGLAEDLPRLARIRASSRERMARSPLCDGKLFAANLLPLLRDTWRGWTARPGK